MRFSAAPVAIAAIFAANSQLAASFALHSKAPLQRSIGRCAPVSSSNSPSWMRTKTNILAASVPVEIKSNFVSNIVSRIRDFTSGILITNKIAAIGAVIISAVFLILREVLWKPSRTYDRDANSVGREYDAWTTEGILEEYWGEHIHLGYYSPEELAAGYKKKNFIQAKYDFVDQMMDFGKARSLAQPMTVLDVGCGIGGKIKMPSS
jgi:hypothetical protein